MILKLHTCVMKQDQMHINFWSLDLTSKRSLHNKYIFHREIKLYITNLHSLFQNVGHMVVFIVVYNVIMLHLTLEKCHVAENLGKRLTISKILCCEIFDFLYVSGIKFIRATSRFGGTKSKTCDRLWLA